MKGYVIDKNGNEELLPDFLSWDICHGMGEPCDFFEVSYIYYTTQLCLLEDAVRFKAVHNNEVVFIGIVDEYTVTIDERGCVATINGRSLAALLLDNAVGAAAYPSVNLTQILNTYVKPLGITDIRSTTMPALYNFSVSVGESAWGVLKRYCRYASNIQPRFSKDGKLILDKAAGDSALINSDKDVVAVRLHNERYGIISTVQMINRVTGQIYTVNNQKFINSGGKRRHVMTIPRNLGANAARYTGEYQIAESEREKKYVELTMTVQFRFFPGDVVHIFNDALGLDGTYTVASTHCWADGVSAGTVLKLEV